MTTHHKNHLTNEPGTRAKVVLIVNKITNLIWSFIAISLILIALIISSVKLFISDLTEYKPQIESYLSERLGRDVKIDALSFEWPSVGPRVQFKHLEFSPDKNEKLNSLIIANGAVVIDLWRSFFAMEFITDEINLQGIQIYYSPENNQGKSNHSTQNLSLKKSNNFRQEVINWLLQQRTIEIYDSFLSVNSFYKNKFSLALPLFTFHGSFETHQLNGMAVTNHGKKIIVKSQMIGASDNPKRKIQFYFNAKNIDLNDLPLDLIFKKYTNIKGSVALEAWADFKATHMQQLVLRASADHLLAGKKKINFSIPDSYILWQRSHDNNWKFRSTPIALKLNDKKIPEFILSGQRMISKTSKLKTWTFQGLSLPVELIGGIISDQLPGKVQNWINKAKPHGMITEIGSSFAPNIQKPTFNIHFKLNNFSMKQIGNLPGASAIDANVNLSDSQAKIAIDSKKGQLNLFPLLRKPLKFNHLLMDLSYQFKSKPIFQWNRFEFENKDIHINSMGKIEYLDNGNGYLEISTQLQNLDTAHTSDFLPVSIMSKNTVDYLDSTIKKGKLTKANAIVRGDFKHFPYINGEGVFDVQAQLENTLFQFLPKWPAAKGLDATLRFHGNNMLIVANKGYVDDVPVSKAIAEIKELSNGHNHLLLDIRTSSTGSKAIQLLKKTPLESISNSLSFLDFSKNNDEFNKAVDLINTHIKINAPLGHPKGVTIDGTISLKDNRMAIKLPRLPLQKVNGDIKFTERGLEHSKVSAELWGQPLSASINRKNTKTLIRVDTYLSTKSINALSQLNFNNYIKGKTPLSAKISFSPSKKSDSIATQIDLFSSLNGLSFQFPDQMIKKRQDKLDWVGHIKLHKDEVHISSQLGKALIFDASKQSSLDLWQGNLKSQGKTFSIQNNVPWTADIHIEKLHLDKWFSVIKDVFFQENQPSRVFNDASIPKFNIQINTDNLFIFNKTFNSNQLNLDSSNGLNLNFKGKTIKGSLRYSNDIQKPILAKFDHIWIPDPIIDSNLKTKKSKKHAYATKPLSTISPNKVPSFSFECHRCQYHDFKLGSIIIQLEKLENNVFIHGSWKKDDVLDAQFEGFWRNNSSSISGTLTSKDFNKLTQMWSLSSGIKQSQLSSQFALSWPGSPWDFDLRPLKGKISTELSKGYIEEVSTQGAQVFSLFSLQNLKRRLALDFNDVYKKGFFYDSIKGSFILDQGKAFSQGLIINGTAAQISMTGYTDLIEGIFDQHLVVIPKLSSSLPVLAGWAISPPTALIAFLVNKLFLKPALDVVTRIDYQITGPWDKPSLRELSKKKKEIIVKDKAEKPKKEQHNRLNGQSSL